MNRALIGLLAASSALMGSVVSLAHGALMTAIILTGVAAAGLAACLAARDDKKPPVLHLHVVTPEKKSL